MDVKSVPEYYILKRWTKLARSETFHNVDVSYVEEDVDLSSAKRYKEICPRLIRIATEACRSPEAFTFLRKITNELNKHMLEFQKNPINISQVNEFIGKVKESTSIHDDLTQTKGFIKIEGKKSSKCLEGLVESQPPKRKKNLGSKASQVQENIHEDITKLNRPEKSEEDIFSTVTCYCFHLRVVRI
ncbi:protein FAR1-RELATED SEQUENCE 1 [Lathyrus oleraceus]|uniref:Protein FAR1-RELATED SEQUENCE n=1 Tax=Pisum sativum TaxID=3888 RepID=A0A9D4WF06_PEA|nr:protein FAR1-RELATED SEQUENCE 1-like [Pisum sativum]KAI5400323.1 hypothetical protein KIW84_065274 [Pisum sativum]